MWTQRTVGSIVALLGTLGLGLSALGIFAVTSYAANRRTKEAGIRLAVGASQRDLVRLFIRGALWPAALGLALGTAGALAVSRGLQSIVPQAVGAGLPITLGSAVLVGLVAAWAALVPAHGVARRDPVAALRCD